MKTSIEESFYEVQQFHQGWLWVIIAAMAIFFWGSFIKQILPFGTRTIPDMGLIIPWLLMGVILPWLFYSMKLISFVKPDGIYFRFVPLHFSYHRIAFSDVRSYEIRTYNPIREYGGWGIRYGFNGKAYNVSGDKGIQFVLQNGKKILIGTLKPEEFYQAIEENVHK